MKLKVTYKTRDGREIVEYYDIAGSEPTPDYQTRAEAQGWTVKNVNVIDDL